MRVSSESASQWYDYSLFLSQVLRCVSDTSSRNEVIGHWCWDLDGWLRLERRTRNTRKVFAEGDWE
jgi:hypothetical protein